MPPEQFLDFRRTDERTDIYALGKILYEAIEGRIRANTIPFKQVKLKNTISIFFKKLDAIIQNVTAEEKESRTSSVKELRNELMKVLGSMKNPAACQQVLRYRGYFLRFFLHTENGFLGFLSPLRPRLYSDWYGFLGSPGSPCRYPPI